jgi:hypothetical protein
LVGWSRVLPRLKSSGWTSLSLMRVLERARNHALHEAAKRDALLRESWRNLRAENPGIRRFAFVWSAASRDGRGRICRRR